jgi:hypothetical protein
MQDHFDELHLREIEKIGLVWRVNVRQQSQSDHALHEVS